ncbi:hypothetical protein GJAV_G00183220 [Gymnothorax javanicus]|nr:hypothetical protein GJAV_G00183220 [Gymnothorax javanicus]
MSCDKFVTRCVCRRKMADGGCGAVMESVLLVAPVTALEFLGEDYLLTGEGPTLSVYSLQNATTACASLSVLRSQRIHGICPDPWQQERVTLTEEEEQEGLEPSPWQQDKGGNAAFSEEGGDSEWSPWQQYGAVRSAVLAVFGGKAVRVVGFREEGGGAALHPMGPLHELQDWVSDARWLRGPTSLLAVALAHNAVLLLEVGRGRSLALRYCQEGCLLYSALLLGQQWDRVVVVGGTVFNQVVMWRPGAGGRWGLSGGGAEERAPVEIRLRGHGGVIFGLAYQREHGWLASASDDRSVRLWGVGVLGGAQGGADPAPSCLRVLYGHQARVFTVRLSAGCVFSAGEDGACLQWSVESGRVERALRGHRAGGVRALALSEGREGRRWVATGGADGGVRLWRLQEGRGGGGEGSTETHTLVDLGFDGGGTPRVVRVVGEGGGVVLSTDRGEVHLCEGGLWRLVWAGGAEFQSYTVMEVLSLSGGGTGVGLCAVGSLTGAVCVFPLSQPSAQVRLRAGEGKVLSVLWAGPAGGRAYLLASGEAGLVHRWQLEVESEGQGLELEGRGLVISATPLPSLLLPPCAKRWLTTVQFLDRPQGALWFCGDRRGSLLLYREQREGEGDRGEMEGEEEGGKGEMEDEEGGGDEEQEAGGGGEEKSVREAGMGSALQPVSTLFGAHGKQGVTWVCEHQGALFSCGRDGCVRELRVGPGARLEVLRAERACRGMEWVERVLVQDGGRMLVLGFHSVCFVVWDPARQERLLSVSCGGGHRSWGFCPPRGPLVFLKQGAVLTSRASPGLCGGDSWGVKGGLHGRGIGCVCRLGRAGPWEILTTGGEDTTLSVLAVQPLSGERAVLSVITDHISGVRALAAVPREQADEQTDGQTSSFSTLLLSAGGRAQLQCYRLLIGWSSQLGLPTCQVMQVAGHRLDEQWERRRNRHKTVKMDPETRYMSLAVLHDGTAGVLLAVACSDGAVRVFSVSEEDRRFLLLWESFHHQRCVLSVAPCCVEDPLGNRRLFVVSGATDGSVALWDVSTLPDWKTMCTADLAWDGPDGPCFSLRVHQSGVNSLVVWAGHREEAGLEEEDGAEPEEKEAVWMTVASGGDDGQLSVVNIRLQFLLLQTEGSAVLVQLHTRSEATLAHAAPVTALQRLGPSLLVSASPDQRVCVWGLSPTSQKRPRATHKQSSTPQSQSSASQQQCSTHCRQDSAHNQTGPTLHQQGTLFSHVADVTGVECVGWMVNDRLKETGVGHVPLFCGVACLREWRKGRLTRVYSQTHPSILALPQRPASTGEETLFLGALWCRMRPVMSRARLPLIGSSDQTPGKPIQPGLQRPPQARRRKGAPPAWTGSPDAMAPWAGSSLSESSFPCIPALTAPPALPHAPLPHSPSPAAHMLQALETVSWAGRHRPLPLRRPPGTPRLPPLHPVTNLSFTRSFTFSFFQLPQHLTPRGRADRARRVSLLLRQIQY